MKKYLKLFCGMSLLTCSLFASEFDAEVKKNIGLINDKLPMSIDSKTKWTKAYVEEKKVVYVFKLDADLKVLPIKFVKSVENQMCGNPVTQTLLAQNYEPLIQYENKSGKNISNISITKKVCGYSN